jgi:NTP pyrophosphatase (non-canonical NTP hydrolase)
VFPERPDRTIKGTAVDIAEAQKLAWENKLKKGFNTTDMALEFGLLTAEVGEAFTAWRKGLPDHGEELADVFLYLVAIAEMQGVDLSEEVKHKIEKNTRRVYGSGTNGTLVRTSRE